MKNYYEKCKTLDDFHEVYKKLVKKYITSYYGVDAIKFMAKIDKQFEDALSEFCMKYN